MLGRSLIVFGIVIAVIGAIIAFVPGLRLGRLPGDLSFGGNGWRVYFPVVTSIVLSVVITLLFALFGFISRR